MDPAAAAPPAPRPAAILHVDIDAFFASVEQLLDPRLKGRPVIVGGGVIASCSYEARRWGLGAGMPLSEARRRCPEVVILDGHEKIYRAFAGRVFDICRRIAPAVETYLDEACCDLSGTERLHGGNFAGAARCLKDLVRREVGLPVTVGLGSNRMVAKLAGKSVKPDGLRCVPPGEEEAFIRDLPVGRLPGVGPATGAVLERLNIRTIGQLRTLSAAQMEGLFGVVGLALHERCRGRDTRPVLAREIPQSISRETSFHRDTTDPGEIAGMLYYLAERAVRAARRLHLKARAVTVRLRYTDSGGAVVSRTLPGPSDRDEEIAGLAADLLRGLHSRRESLHGVGIALSKFVMADAGQLDLFDAGRGPRLDRLYRGLDRVRDRFGHSAIVAGKSINLLGRLEQDGYGFVLRTPSLTR